MNMNVNVEQNTATQRSYIPIDMKIKDILDAHKQKENTCVICGGHNLVKLPDRGRREVLKGERWGSGGIHGRQFTINSQRVCKNCGVLQTLDKQGNPIVEHDEGELR